MSLEGFFSAALGLVLIPLPLIFNSLFQWSCHFKRILQAILGCFPKGQQTQRVQAKLTAVAFLQQSLLCNPCGLLHK
uniref:Uncharacterized protein n=1 Tax=Varanus komodoensis TaxID=61221 RepID=A0A8D2JCJ5_VARKO